MLREAFRRGVKAALAEEGIDKLASWWHSLITHPATVGAVLGTGGSALSDLVRGSTPDWKKALGAGAAGAAIGAGVRYGAPLLHGLAKKFPRLGKEMLTPAGSLAPGVADIGWLAPSLVAAPVITSAVGTNQNTVGTRHSRSSGKR